jgi:hypothetical protein
VEASNSRAITLIFGFFFICPFSLFLLSVLPSFPFFRFGFFTPPPLLSVFRLMPIPTYLGLKGLMVVVVQILAVMHIWRWTDP